MANRYQFQDFFGKVQELSYKEKLQQYLFSIDPDNLYALQFFNEEKNKWVYACPQENADEEKRYKYILSSKKEALDYMARKLDTGKALRVVKVSRYLPDSAEIQVKEILQSNF